jgi:gliding motility-associated-like protein
MKLSRSYHILILAALLSLSITSSGITANFSVTKVTNCAPSVVRFTNNSTRGTGITYFWDFGQGATVATTDYTVKEQIFMQSGKYKITLVVSDGTNRDTATTDVSIFKGPVADFTADKLTGCPPLMVKFTSTSIPGDSEIATTLWDFRNGDNKEGTSILYTYNNTGLFDVLLKVTDKNGCSGYIESDNVINISPKPQVAFSASDTFACVPPLNVSFINMSAGSSELSYKWDFGNGKISSALSASSVYSSSGIYSVKLKATDQNGCSDSLIRNSYIVVGYPKAALEVYDSRNNVISTPYLCDGKYRFVCSAAKLPRYKWTFTENNIATVITGSSSVSYLIKGTGFVDIKVVYGNDPFCSDSVSASFIKSYIKADFTIDNNLVCSFPVTVKLNNSSQNANGFSWYCSGKKISSEKNTTYTITKKDIPEESYRQMYDHDISYIKIPFKLVASNSGICFDSITNEVTIALPVARFMTDRVSGCIPMQVTFSDSSRSPKTIDHYIYRIGSDSVTSTGKVPLKYTFTKPGEYKVYEVIKSGGCSDTSHIVTVVAGEKLKPDFTVSPSEICNGDTIHLTGNIPGKSVYALWRFRSSNLFDLGFNSAPDTSFAVISDSTGFRNIGLSVDYNGCISDTVKEAVLRINGPAGNFSERFICDSALIYHFKSQIRSATSLRWNIDTALFNHLDSVRYAFPEGGNYLVRLSATDALSGCTLDRTKTINVRQVLADFALNDTIFCAGDTVKMNSSDSKDFISNCYNEGFLWSFGDDSPPRRTFLTEYNHIYSSKGTKRIKLMVLADNGCSDTISKTVKIFRPSGSFSVDKTSGCLPEMTINFKNTSTDTTIVNWVWNFGDKTDDRSSAVDIAHKYTASKQQTFYSALSVYDAYQCSSSSSIPVHLDGLNKDFQADDNAVCTGQTVTLTPVNSSLTTMKWNFGDGSPSSLEGTHTYLKAGLYSVMLTASNESCTDSLTKQNFISVESADASFTASDSIFSCFPQTVRFIHNPSLASPVVDYRWTFDSHLQSGSSSNDVKYTFTRAGKFSASLTVRTLNGCSATRSKTITINGPYAAISFSPKDICYNSTVTFHLDSLKNIASWKWFFGDGTTSTSNPVSHKYTSRGKLVPSIQLTNATCSGIIALDTLYISKVQALFNTADSTFTVCNGNRLTILNKSKDSDSWNWAINNVSVSNDYNLSNILLGKTGDYNIRLVAKESEGCTDTLVKKYSVVPFPTFDIVGDSVICAGSNSTSLSVDPNSGKSIRWTPSTGLNSTTTFKVTASPQVATTYSALVTNSYGCSTTKTRKILVNQPFGLTRKPLGDTTIYAGESVQLSTLADAENVSYKWSPKRNISCITCYDPWVSPVEATTYKVELKNGCFDFFETFVVEVIRDFYLEAPSAFSPNGDSNNDSFRFEYKNIRNFELNIFNRWGKIVFTSKDINSGWDGNVNGHPQNTDTYVYSVRAETIHGYSFEKKGEFLLLK